MDEILESPKLRIKLSPAELDKQLLELYDSISESAGGDVLRILGGGGQIALQNLYMKRHAERERWRKLKNKDRPLIVSLLPSFGVQDVTTEDFQRTASQWVRWSLRKNQQKLAKSLNLRTDKSKSPRRTTTNSDEVQDPASTTALLTKRTSDDDTDTKNTPTMSYKSFARISPSTTRRNMSGLCTWNGLCRKAPPQRKSKFAILI